MNMNVTLDTNHATIEAPITERANPTCNPTDELYFSQVREDPEVEMAALGDLKGKHIAVVASGGCTALSFLCRGANVAAIDLNSAQINLVELKSIALKLLPYDEALRFLGAKPANGAFRLRTWNKLADYVSQPCQNYWDEHQKFIERGVLRAGRSERFIKLFVFVLRHMIQTPEKVVKLLTLSSLEEQHEFFYKEWNNWRWRVLFGVLVNRGTWSKTYSKEFFKYVENQNFAKGFLSIIEHAFTELPIHENYFLHYMINEAYRDDAKPVYLQEQYQDNYRTGTARLSLHDDSMQGYLLSCEDNSLDAVVLSNICEWMTEADIEGLFRLAVKKLKHDGKLIYRNFVGYTPIPSALQNTLIPREELSNRIIKTDRSLLQYRIVVCDINKEG